MGSYVEIGALRTYYDEHGAGDPLVLLHGGLCTNDTWGAQVPDLSARFRVIAPERRGHGHTADTEAPFSYDEMAEETIAFLDSVVRAPAHLVGWSDGGIVGLLVAMARPDLVRKLAVLGANFDAAGILPGVMEHFMSLPPDGPDLAMFRGLYESATPDGAAHWPVVLKKFLAMATTQPHIPVADLKRVVAPTLVLVGDDDMVTLEHTIEMYRAIPTSELAVVPGTSHAVLMEKPELANRLIIDFLSKDAAATMMPMRRAAAH